MNDLDFEGWVCPTPLRDTPTIVMGHGGGGAMSGELIESLFLPAFGGAAHAELGDSAVLPRPAGRLAFSTDSFVVKPMFFPGGSIGDLAVNGTVNDLAMSGAVPLYLSTAFILAEGTALADIGRVAMAVGKAAEVAGVQLVTGDTKVVDAGSGDGIYVNTAGIGVVPDGVEIGPTRAEVGDAVLVSGDIGVHGIAVMSCREGLEFGTTIESDTAALHGLVADLLATGVDVKVLRDPTRGGVSATLNEIAKASGVGHRAGRARPADPARGPRRLRAAGARPAPGRQRGQAAGDRAGRRRRPGPRGDARSPVGRSARPGSAPAWPSTRGWSWRAPASAGPGWSTSRSASSCPGSAEPSPMSADGAVLFARYAYPPNELGYCGPAGAEQMLDAGRRPTRSDGGRGCSRAPGATSSCSRRRRAPTTRSTSRWSRRTGWAATCSACSTPSDAGDPARTALRRPARRHLARGAGAGGGAPQLPGLRGLPVGAATPRRTAARARRRGPRPLPDPGRGRAGGPGGVADRAHPHPRLGRRRPRRG